MVSQTTCVNARRLKLMTYSVHRDKRSITLCITKVILELTS